MKNLNFMYTSANFSKFSNLVWHIPTAVPICYHNLGFISASPCPCPPPLPLPEGGGCSAISPITGPKFDSMRLMLVDTVCNVYFIFLFPSCKNVGGRGNGPYSNFSNFYIFSLCLAVGLYDTVGVIYALGRHVKESSSNKNSGGLISSECKCAD